MRLNSLQSRELELIFQMAERTGSPLLIVSVRRFREALRRQEAEAPRPLRFQLYLWEDDGTPWRGRLGPDAPIRCEHFGATIPLKTCLQRQDAKWPGKSAAIHEFCASGSCAMGEMNRVRAAYCAGADWASRSKAGRASFQFYRRDAGAQRAARRIYQQSQPDRLLSEEESQPRLDGEDEDDVQEVVRGGGG